MVATTDPAKKPRFVVGVDFGTTFTAVAWAHSAAPEDVKLVQTWPNGSTGNPSADQVPTELQYLNASTREKLWGYEIPKFNKTDDGPETLKWFKLLLQQDNSSSTMARRPSRSSASWSPPASAIHSPGPSTWHGNLSRLRELAISPAMSVVSSGWEESTEKFTAPTVTPDQKTKQMLGELGISPVTAVSDFLKSVRAITVTSIERTYSAEWVKEVPIKYVLTVPAIWTDSAKNLMVQAAELAGYGAHRKDFNLVSEPEAAAAYTLKAIQPNDLNRGDTFIICDAGGGTVDLISYKITDLSPLKLDEAVSGTGYLCGSIFLDDRFGQYIRRVLGDDAIDSMKPRSKSEMMRTWEEKVKMRFGNTTSDESYEVNVPSIPDNERKRVEDGFHAMEYEDVKQIFDPIVDRIVKLVKQQVRGVEKKGERVAAILLVGGFGSSEYLLQRLQATRYGGRSIQVLQPMNARSAIVRGALMRGLDGSIVGEKRARRYYGSSSHHRCDEDEQHTMSEHKYWCDKEEVFKVPHHMNWYVKRDQVVGRTVSTSFGFYRMVSLRNPDFIFHTDLEVCDLEEAPNYKWKNPGAVYRLCTLKADLRNISTKKFKRITNSKGQKFYRVEYKLIMEVEDEVLKFELEFDGERCGSVAAQFEYQ